MWDLLFIAISVIALLVIMYVSVLFIETNEKRFWLKTIWIVIIVASFNISYHMLKIVDTINEKSTMMLMLFLINIIILSSYSKKDD